MPTLSHTQLTAPGSSPTRWLLVLHGLLGRGGNWRTLTRALVQAHPTWGGVLVDLRMHGASQGFAAPHTVEAAARDLDDVAALLSGPVEAVLGHSLGGKVALRWAARREGLRRAFLLDTNPGPRPVGRGSETTAQVLSVLHALPAELPSREAFVAEVQAQGLSSDVGHWLAMNLVARGDGFVFSLDLQAMQSLFEDVLRQNDWQLLENPPLGLRFDVILGGASRTVQGEDLLRLEGLAAAGRLRLTVLPKAGHWVQVDDPQGTLRAVSEGLD